MKSKRLVIGTDVATVVLFHPDDLAHRRTDPIAWYAYDFVYSAESRAGRLVAFGTGSDGGYAVRLTTGGLAPDEAARACPGWDFPLLVRHGRILLDNTDALPGEEQMTDPAELADHWFELAPGAYRVTVHPLVPAGDGPDYVITFAPVEDLASIAVAPSPPDLLRRRDAVPGPAEAMPSEVLFTWPSGSPEGAWAALPVSPDVALLPRHTAVLPVSEAIADAIFPPRDSRVTGTEKLVAGVDFSPGSLVVASRAAGLSRYGESPARLTLQGRQLARVGYGGQGRGKGAVFETVMLEPLAKPDMAAPPEAAAALRAALSAAMAERSDLAGRLRHPAFELERLRSLVTAEAVTGWALLHLPLSWADRLACYASPAAARIAALMRRLEAGSRP